MRPRRNTHTAGMTFTERELVDLRLSVSTERENVGSTWDDARALGQDDASYWQERHDRLSQLDRRLERAQRRLARKRGDR